MKKIISVLIVSLLVTGCMAPKTRQIKIDQDYVKQERAKQQQLALKYLTDMQIRLNENAYPLLKSATGFCEDDQGPALGLLTASEFSYNKDFRETARELLDLDNQLEIMHVISNSPAAKAGLKKNDRILAINGTTIPASEKGKSVFSDALKKHGFNTSRLKLKRNGEMLTVSVTPDKQCNYQIELSESDTVNAYANGSKVTVTKGMMKFATTTKELSLVVSHEIAHNVMGHITSKTLNSLGGTLLDIATAVATGVSTQGTFAKIGASMYSQEFEAEADYVGLYIMARAGQDTEDAEFFWRRMAVEHPSSISSNHTSSHPATPERFVSIEKTVHQINEKKTAGQALMPDMK